MAPKKKGVRVTDTPAKQAQEQVHPMETPTGQEQKRVRTAQDEKEITKTQTLKEMAADLYQTGGITRKEADQMARELRQAEKTEARAGSTSRPASSEATSSNGAAPRELDVRTSLPVASEATGGEDTNHTNPHRIKAAEIEAMAPLAMSYQRPGATAATKEPVTEGATREAKPLEATPDLRQFFMKTDQGGHELPPASDVSICSPANPTHVERVAAPPTAAFPEAEDALSSASEAEPCLECPMRSGAAVSALDANVAMPSPMWQPALAVHASRTQDQAAPSTTHDGQPSVQPGQDPAGFVIDALQLVNDLIGPCQEMSHLPGKSQEDTAGASR